MMMRRMKLGELPAPLRAAVKGTHGCVQVTDHDDMTNAAYLSGCSGNIVFASNGRTPRMAIAGLSRVVLRAARRTLEAAGWEFQQ